jgi:hypothetical protein
MTPDKQTVMLELLKDAWVYVQIDPRRDGVALPDFLRQQPRVVLQYGYNMPVPIHDLVIDERGISATLSFRRVAHATLIPWAAVFALSDGEQRGFVWPEDVPPDLHIEAQPESQPATGPQAAPPSKEDQPSKPGSATGPGPGRGKKPRPSHLKLVD